MMIAAVAKAGVWLLCSHDLECHWHAAVRVSMHGLVRCRCGQQQIARRWCVVYQCTILTHALHAQRTVSASAQLLSRHTRCNCPPHLQVLQHVKGTRILHSHSVRVHCTRKSKGEGVSAEHGNVSVERNCTCAKREATSREQVADVAHLHHG